MSFSTEYSVILKTRNRLPLTILLVLILLLMVATNSAFTVSKGPIIAVSYFDNTSNIPEFDPLKKGLADMLITDLSKAPGIVIVEREKLEQELLGEIELSKSPYIDRSTAQKLGHGPWCCQR